MFTHQFREFDRRASEEYGLSGLVLMENAGRGCVDILEALGIGGPVLIGCGKGNNGGDGLVIARHLDARGFRVGVLLAASPDEFRGDAATNWAVFRRCRVPWAVVAPDGSDTARQLDQVLGGRPPDWCLDALLGTGSRGEPRPPLAPLIAAFNRLAAKRMAVDLPSGLDGDTGHAAETTFRADHTCTFVSVKQGFGVAAAQPYLGRVHVVNLGVPRPLLEEYLGS